MTSSAPLPVSRAPGKTTSGALGSVVAMIALLGLFGVVTLSIMVAGPGTPQDERVARTPVLPHDLGSLKAFASDAKFYISQRYAGKQLFVALNGEAKMRLFGHSPTPDVVLGRDGTLFLGDGASIGNDVDSTIGTPPPAFASDIAWLDLYRTMGQAFRARHIPLVQIIAPDKSAVLSQKLPAWMAPQRTPRGKDIVHRIAQYSEPPAVDLFGHLDRLQRSDPALMLYHATDTHWTELGAALAIDAALAPLGRTPVPQGPPPFRMAGVHGGDLARMVGRQDTIRAQAPIVERPSHLSCITPEGKPAVVMTLDPLPEERFTCTNSDAMPGHALIFMDSFGMAAVPRLTHYFRTTDFVWSDQVSMKEVDDIKPDVAIRIMVARKLQSANPADMLVD